MAEADLKAALEANGLAYEVKAGEGAFYGPKIDVDIQDALGRPWQLNTTQLDFQMPERFKLEYVGEDGQRASAGDDPPRHLSARTSGSWRC